MIDLQLFGGKGSTSTTTYTSRPLTDDEKRMEKSYADYAEAIQPSAYHLYNTATDRLTAADNVNPNYNNLYNQQAANTANLTNQFNNLNSNVNNQLSTLNGAITNANNRANSNSGLLSAQTQATNNQLTSGVIPQAVQDARQNTVNRMAQTGMGNLLTDNAARGVINSSVMSSGLDSLNNSVANAINDSYSQDLNSANAAANQALANTANYVNNDNNTAQQYLSNLSSGISQNYNTGSGLLSTGLNLANTPIQQANQAQQASYQLPLQLYGAATGQMSPTASIYQQATASQNGGTQSTSTTQGGGGLFGSILGIGLGHSSFGSNW